ncbi:MAG: Nif3-like dinuclear metal center hexameric protein [Thermodesulfobacteriota bacterium]|nr:Nif3-like dinuclear metal center hexameric protein [Thermodesulfobacteriota bacterium]
MVVTTLDLLNLVDCIAPFSLAEEWDNSGLQAGDFAWPVKKVLVALDISPEVMDEAVKWGADLVLTHHPLMLKPAKSIDFGKMPGSVIFKAAVEKISIISAHTNLDKAENGLNDLFAQIIGFKNLVPLLPQFAGSDMDSMAGMGRKGDLLESLTLGELAESIKKKFHPVNLRIAGKKDFLIESAVVCTGSGASLTGEFFRSGADVFITGDMKYHEAKSIEQAGKALIDVGHFASEHIAVALMVEKLGAAAQSFGYHLNIRGFEEEIDPFVIV